MKKIKNSFTGIFFGIILLIVGSILIWWNEGNNVKNIKTVDEVKKNVVEVDSSKIDSSNNGKLIATSGNLEILDDQVSDYTFSVSQKTAKLKRVVEIYQWEEETKDSGENKTYSYKKVWSDELIDSSQFNKSGYDNPTYVSYSNESYQASEVKVGEFYLSEDQIKDLSTPTRLNLDDSLYIPYGYSISDNYITNSSNISSPEIGDIRISYYYNNYDKASVLAVQDGNTFKTFVSKSNKKVNRVEEGVLTSNEIINKMISENNTVKWIFRFIGCLLVIIGYSLILNFISTMTSFIPVLGNFIGFALFIIGVLVGLIHSLLIFILAWIRFRPILGISLLLVVGALIVILIKYTKKNKGTEIKNNNQINNTQQQINQIPNEQAIPQQQTNQIPNEQAIPQQQINQIPNEQAIPQSNLEQSTGQTNTSFIPEQINNQENNK